LFQVDLRLGDIRHLLLDERGHICTVFAHYLTL
jgi:hypothetical protein